MEKSQKHTKLVEKLSKADIGVLADTAAEALEKGTELELLQLLKDYLIKDAPITTRRMLGDGIAERVLEALELPYKDDLTSEQLAQQMADSSLTMVSAFARGAIKAGTTEEFLQGIIELHASHPAKCHEFLGDSLTLLLHNYLKLNK